MSNLYSNLAQELENRGALDSKRGIALLRAQTLSLLQEKYIKDGGGSRFDSYVEMNYQRTYLAIKNVFEGHFSAKESNSSID